MPVQPEEEAPEEPPEDPLEEPPDDPPEEPPDDPPEEPPEDPPEEVGVHLHSFPGIPSSMKPEGQRGQQKPREQVSELKQHLVEPPEVQVVVPEAQPEEPPEEVGEHLQGKVGSGFSTVPEVQGGQQSP